MGYLALCPRSLDPFYIVSYNTQLVKTSSRQTFLIYRRVRTQKWRNIIIYGIPDANETLIWSRIRIKSKSSQFFFVYGHAMELKEDKIRHYIRVYGFILFQTYVSIVNLNYRHFDSVLKTIGTWIQIWALWGSDSRAESCSGNERIITTRVIYQVGFYADYTICLRSSDPF